jgi:hypothetical protein
MPTELKVVIAIHTVATVLIGALAVLGGGFVAGNEPPARASELQLVPVAAVPAGRQAPGPDPMTSMHAPSGYRIPDPIAPRWRVAADGTVHFAPDGSASGARSTFQPQ